MAESATWHLVRAGQERPFVVEGDVIVGRGKQADLRIVEGDGSFVSRRHARLWLDGDDLMVEDLGSANGTFVNGNRLSSSWKLSPGDRVCFDETEFHVEVHGERAGVDPNATAHRPDDDPEFPKPERPADWNVARTQMMGTGPSRADSIEDPAFDLDLDLDFDAAAENAPPAPPAQKPATRSPPRAAPSPPSVHSDEFDLNLTAEAPSSPPAETSRRQIDDDLTVEAEHDLSIGQARPEESPPPAKTPAATVIMSRESAPAFAGPPPAAPSGEMVGILGLSGPIEGQLYQLADGRVSIGRSPECDIVVDESSVSKRHAELLIQPGNSRIYDLSRSNGVFVNGNPVDDVALNPGDVIRFGRVEIMFDSYERLAGESGEGDGVPAWVWMIAGFVGAGAILAVGALFVL